MHLIKNGFFSSVLLSVLFSFFLLPNSEAVTQSISAGDSHTLIINGDQTIWATGRNLYGQLGDGVSFNDSPIFKKTFGLSNVLSVSAGSEHSLAIKRNNENTANEVWSWGSDEFGELGNGEATGNRNIPASVIFKENNEVISPNIIAIGAGYGHSLALESNGTGKNVWAWGENNYGQLGDGTNENKNEPVKISALENKDIIAISAGDFHSLALEANGTVWAWGRNFAGQLGVGTNEDSNIPVALNLQYIIAIAAGGGHSMALKKIGGGQSTVWTWGGNLKGQLGDGTTTGSNVPVQVKADPVNFFYNAVSISASNGHNSLALDDQGNVWSWGSNTDSQLGNGQTPGDMPYSEYPTAVSTIKNIVTIDMGYKHGEAIDENGIVWAWGSDAAGQLGNGNSSNSPTPFRRYEDNDNDFTYVNPTNWNTYLCSECSLGTLKYASLKNANASFSFTGTGIKFIFAKASTLGKARIYLDGVSIGMVDQYSADTIPQVELTHTGLSNAVHTVKIEVSGQRNAESTGNSINIDAFELIP